VTAIKYSANNDLDATESARRTALDGMSQALLPLVRLYLRAGLGAGEFTIAAKLAFMRVAAESARIGPRLNLSAISAATGMTRKEVRSMVELARETAQLPTRGISRQRTTRVIHGWQTDPAFLDHEGNSAVLPIKGANISFASLVRRYGGDVTPISVLRELERAGAVSRNKSGTVRLRKQSTRLKGYNAESMAEITTRIRDLAATMVGNIARADRPTYTGFQDVTSLPAEVAALFHSTFSERSALLLDGVGRWVTTQKRLRKTAEAAVADKRRIGIGIYLVDESAGEGAPLSLRPVSGRSRKLKRGGPA
jgi:Family of unknown function (DUF6502)